MKINQRMKATGEERRMMFVIISTNFECDTHERCVQGLECGFELVVFPFTVLRVSRKQVRPFIL